MKSTIKIENLTKKYSDKIIFSNISFTFEKKFYHLIGQNGSGKTTLLKMLIGLEKPDIGEIYYNQNLLGANNNIFKEKIFYIPNELTIYPFIRGLEFLTWIGHARRSNNLQIENIIAEFNLLQYVNTPFCDMSFGTKKKFLIASAMVGEPDFIILDEPFNGLDKESDKILTTIINDKLDKVGLIVTSHKESEMLALHSTKIEIANCGLYEQ
jgi:ABC-2 type transport system ATP-binding protein